MRAPCRRGPSWAARAVAPAARDAAPGPGAPVVAATRRPRPGLPGGAARGRAPCAAGTARQLGGGHAAATTSCLLGRGGPCRPPAPPSARGEEGECPPRTRRLPWRRGGVTVEQVVVHVSRPGRRELVDIFCVPQET